ncbi:DNA polymerase catalytic subunit [Klebsormidium nitens]|uniref:DNA polymerase delta catalytic subunit n=1 Tax=Klebsormidium nitens TaxID=105231 RepID=A0A1Y1HM97_KLENI|nr:DNA polymerase catalytic subunit [Klebsormidium nitens]|eukprot:GAQ79724.1 DNA polymerase catalytic subunit [Klebsormidium nitens]
MDTLGKKAWEVPPSSPLPDVRGANMQSKKRGRSSSLKGQAMLKETVAEGEKRESPQAPVSKKSRGAYEEAAPPESPSLKMMVVDLVVEDGVAATGGRGEGGRPPRALLYGLTAEGESVCCHVSDFTPYFWFPAPISLPSQEGGEDCPLSETELDIVLERLNQKVASSKQRTGSRGDKPIVRLTQEDRMPIMYYRPKGLYPFLKVEYWRNKDAGVIAKELSRLASENALKERGIAWRIGSPCAYEEDIKFGMRFMCETKIAGGAWLTVPRDKLDPIPLAERRAPRCSLEMNVLSWHDITGLTPDATSGMTFEHALPGSGTAGAESDSAAAADIAAAVREHDDRASLLSPEDESLLEEGEGALSETGAAPLKDATASDTGNQTGRKGSSADKQGLEESASVSEGLAVAPLKILAVNVQTAGRGSVDSHGKVGLEHSAPSSQSSKRGSKAKGKAAVSSPESSKSAAPAMTSSTATELEVLEGVPGSDVAGGGVALPNRDPVLMISNRIRRSAEPDAKQKLVVFTFREGFVAPPGVDGRVFKTESEMLRAWKRFATEEADPDVICLFQLKESLRYLNERFKHLKLGSLDLGRRPNKALEVKSVVSYGKNWVKNQQRMTATSNLETYRATVEGRVVVDMLRSITIAHNLSTFTLAECSQVFLGETKEVLSAAAITALWAGRHGGPSRLAVYSLREAELALRLLDKLQIITETLEMARVTGLTLSDVLYKAQMIRVQSLLLRSAGKEGGLLGGPPLGGQLSESPFLLHPKERQTAGLYQDPVAILDFASLYPSLFIGHNLCYSTLLHPDDVAALDPTDVYTTPTGAHFVRTAVRHGILPRICSALIATRKQARDRMAERDITPTERAVLDGRQKALKLCSNALYGFTGAQASPMQALPLADSCLAMGAAACKKAVELVNGAFDNGKVIYAQTDSVFVRFKGASIAEAIELGHQASAVASAAFPPPISLKFERVLSPFLLLQVNRYAGRQFTSAGEGKGQGTLFVKGVEVDRRDVPGFVRIVCKRVLQKILVDRDVDGAVEASTAMIRRLVGGKCSMSDLVMTGGLWRVNDEDITRVAAGTPSKGPSGQREGPATAEEGRGPHVSLAVRLKRRDGDRQFHIGERIPYVLVSGRGKLQDDMAEDPVEAARRGLAPNIGVYLENKLRKPLESIFEYVVSDKVLRELFTGPHTIPPPSMAAAAAASGGGKQSLMSTFFKPKPACLGCRRPMEAERGPLCASCGASGAGQRVVAELAAEQREQEALFAAAASESVRCHSGTPFDPVLDTNADSPAFFIRYEAPRALQQIEQSISRFEES